MIPVKKEEDVEMRDKPSVSERLSESVEIGEKAPSNTGTVSFHGTFSGVDNSYSFSQFKSDFSVEIIKSTISELEFDLIGVDAPLANALRRIMISEVPTIAIDKVVVNDNTSVLSDDILVHRLGLIPIMADPHKFRTKAGMREEQETNALEFEKRDSKSSEEYTPQYKVVANEDVLFRLSAHCKKQSNGQIVGDKVYAKHLKWIPFGDQAHMFHSQPIRPVLEDILICVLAPNQGIDMEIYAEKGIGKTHSKWSPVATAFYRLMPKVQVKGVVSGQEAVQIVEKCKMGVFDIEDSQLVVSDPRKCTTCRECIRGGESESEGAGRIKLGKKKKHFIFTVESTGVLSPAQIFRDALGIFFRKCETKLKEMNDLLGGMDDDDDETFVL